MTARPAPITRHVQSHFLNRELGILEFQRRVLAQAEDPVRDELGNLGVVEDGHAGSTCRSGPRHVTFTLPGAWSWSLSYLHLEHSSVRT